MAQGAQARRRSTSDRNIGKSPPMRAVSSFPVTSPAARAATTRNPERAIGLDYVLLPVTGLHYRACCRISLWGQAQMGPGGLATPNRAGAAGAPQQPDR